MNRVFFAVMVVALLHGCAPSPESPPTPLNETAPNAPPPEPAPDVTPAAPATILSMNYIDAASALAEDNMEKAKASLKNLAAESTGELQKLAEAAANTGDIAATRERFKALSAVATKMELPEGYAVALCPMYKGGSKWVQKKETLHNPYFGKTMLTCGSFVN